MDEYFELYGVTFTWNRAKAKANLNKHGIPFEEAAQAFFDPFVQLLDGSVEGDNRHVIVGLDEAWRLLTVVHVDVEEDQIRIISARNATGYEWRTYEA